MAPSFDFDKPLKYPLRFTDNLPFLDEDRASYPWLNDGDRFYRLTTELGRGGYSNAYAGYPCDVNGRRVSALRVVVKIPRLSESHLDKEVSLRTEYINKGNLGEWTLIRQKLLKCKNAKLIFDMGVLIRGTNPLSITVQPLLENALSLDDWLIKNGHKVRSDLDPVTKRPVHDWAGIKRWEDWLPFATLIAEGLREIHKCRVIHGDVWPPNIFIEEEGKPKARERRAIFIDFGEAFGVIPSGDARNQTDHEYRAPERGNKEYVPMEQVDVYSFGKLLLYLTIGKDELIPPIEGGEPLYGQRRRLWVRNKLFERRHDNLVREHPQIVDIISQCTQWDPVDRPAMTGVCDQLYQAMPSNVSRPSRDIAARLEKLTGDIALQDGRISNAFFRIIDSKVRALEELVEGCPTEMVEVRGTRDSLVSDLVCLFAGLTDRDSWTTLTTPSVWQQDALGLDGRYATATIEAVRRGASVQRVYALSVEELGSVWARTFAEKLKLTTEKLNPKDSENLKSWTAIFEELIRVCEFDTGATNFKPRDEKFLAEHQDQFVSLMESLRDTVANFKLDELLAKEQFDSIKNTRKFFLGLLPVSTLSKIREMRTENPVSLMYLDREPKEHDRWLMVMTDIRGRNEYAYVRAGWPQLRGIRVYKSARDVPNDRIISLERLIARKDTLNIAPCIGALANCARQTKSKVRGRTVIA